jgi:hypothetical protein
MTGHVAGALAKQNPCHEATDDGIATHQSRQQKDHFPSEFTGVTNKTTAEK